MGTSSSDISVEISGDDYDTLEMISNDLAAQIAALPDAMQSDASEREERAEPDAWLLARGGFDR